MKQRRTCKKRRICKKRRTCKQRRGKKKYKQSRHKKNQKGGTRPKYHEFFSAVKSGNIHDVSEMLTEDLRLLTFTDCDGNTPLHHAVDTHLNNTDVIDLLMCMDDNLYIFLKKNYYPEYMTPLDRAIKNKNPKNILFLANKIIDRYWGIDSELPKSEEYTAELEKAEHIKQYIMQYYMKPQPPPPPQNELPTVTQEEIEAMEWQASQERLAFEFHPHERPLTNHERNMMEEQKRRHTTSVRARENLGLSPVVSRVVLY